MVHASGPMISCFIPVKTLRARYGRRLYALPLSRSHHPLAKPFKLYTSLFGNEHHHMLHHSGIGRDPESAISHTDMPPQKNVSRLNPPPLLPGDRSAFKSALRLGLGILPNSPSPNSVAHLVNGV